LQNDNIIDKKRIKEGRSDIMLKQRLQQKLLQKLSPQQIQMIKLLEIPTMQLEQRIKKELEENPVLEEGEYEDPDSQEEPEVSDTDSDDEEFSLEDYIEDDEIPTYKLNTNNYSDDDKKRDIPARVINRVPVIP
jgi:RNA polymerase sigma-54 factor